MKKIMLFGLLLSFFACRKVPVVDCKTRTQDVALTQALLIGKWELAYRFFYAQTGNDFYIIPSGTDIEQFVFESSNISNSLSFDNQLFIYYQKKDFFV